MSFLLFSPKEIETLKNTKWTSDFSVYDVLTTPLCIDKMFYRLGESMEHRMIRAEKLKNDK